MEFLLFYFPCVGMTDRFILLQVMIIYLRCSVTFRTTNLLSPENKIHWGMRSKNVTEQELSQCDSLAVCGLCVLLLWLVLIVCKNCFLIVYTRTYKADC